MKPLIVTFDSNTWRKVASPDKFPKDPIIADYQTIRNAIDSQRIVPFLSETIFTLEAIQRGERQSFFGESSLKSAEKVATEEDGTVKVEWTLTPTSAVTPSRTGHLARHLSDAVTAGFKIIRFPRIGGIVDPSLEVHRYQMAGDELTHFLNTAFAAGRKVADLGAGFSSIKAIAERYAPGKGLAEGLLAAPDSENDAIASAIAEWADGDSVASHIGLKGDYFCTLDTAKSGGSKSVFSAANLSILSHDYGFKTITPAELSKLL